MITPVRNTVSAGLICISHVVYIIDIGLVHWYNHQVLVAILTAIVVSWFVKPLVLSDRVLLVRLDYC